jgi:hypothetical protein
MQSQYDVVQAPGGVSYQPSLIDFSNLLNPKQGNQQKSAQQKPAQPGQPPQPGQPGQPQPGQPGQPQGLGSLLNSWFSQPPSPTAFGANGNMNNPNLSGPYTSSAGAIY